METRELEDRPEVILYIHAVRVLHRYGSIEEAIMEDSMYRSMFYRLDALGWLSIAEDAAKQIREAEGVER